MREALAVECRLLYRMLTGKDRAYSSATIEGIEITGPVPELIRAIMKHVDGKGSVRDRALRRYIDAAGTALGEWSVESIAPEDWLAVWRRRRSEAVYRLG